jgi:ferric-dicitrate binding protein FerR (iron transport regulator)
MNNNTMAEKQPATTTAGSLPQMPPGYIDPRTNTGIASEATLEMEDGHDKTIATDTSIDVEKDKSERTFQRGPRFWGIMVASR